MQLGYQASSHVVLALTCLVLLGSYGPHQLGLQRVWPAVAVEAWLQHLQHEQLLRPYGGPIGMAVTSQGLHDLQAEIQPPLPPAGQLVDNTQGKPDWYLSAGRPDHAAGCSGCSAPP